MEIVAIAVGNERYIGSELFVKLDNGRGDEWFCVTLKVGALLVSSRRINCVDVFHFGGG